LGSHIGVSRSATAGGEVGIFLPEKVAPPPCASSRYRLRVVKPGVPRFDPGLPLGRTCFLDVHLLLRSKLQRRQ